MKNYETADDLRALLVTIALEDNGKFPVYVFDGKSARMIESFEYDERDGKPIILISLEE